MASPNESVKIAIVGMTGSGKTVLISTLAMKMAQMALEDIFMAPSGDNRRNTYRYTQSNWKILNEGQWPPSTPAGELISLQWELTTKHNQALVQFLDCAGQDIRSLFRTDYFNPNNLSGDLKSIYENISSANVLIFLVNMKDLLATPDYVEELMDLDQMFHTLNQRNDIPRKMAVVFSQFDKYKPEVDQKFNGDFLEYIRHYIPLLHGQYIRKRNFEIIPVAAVNDTQSVIENGEVKQYPVPGFSSYNLETLIHWIADSVEALAPVIHNYYLEQLRKKSSNTSPFSDYDSNLDASEFSPVLSVFTGITTLIKDVFSFFFLTTKAIVFAILTLICLIISGLLGLFGGALLGNSILGEPGLIIFGIIGLIIGIVIVAKTAEKTYKSWFNKEK